MVVYVQPTHFCRPPAPPTCLCPVCLPSRTPHTGKRLLGTTREQEQWRPPCQSAQEEKSSSSFVVDFGLSSGRTSWSHRKLRVNMDNLQGSFKVGKGGWAGMNWGWVCHLKGRWTLGEVASFLWLPAAFWVWWWWGGEEGG